MLVRTNHCTKAAGVLLALSLFLIAGCSRERAICGDPDTIDQGFTCALITAVGSGTLEDVRALLVAGDDPNCQECSDRLVDGKIVASWGWTPLMVAAMKGDSALVRMLLKEGAEVNTETSAHQNALTYALECRQHEAAKLLREAGATVPTDYPGPPPDRPHGVKRISKEAGS